jgi:hypothetical protein
MSTRALLLFAAPAAATCLLLARPAAADELNPGAGSAGQVTAVNAGVSELALENIFVLGYDQREDTKSFRMSLLVGPTFRYFVARNSVLGFNASLLYKLQDGQVSTSDLGGVLNATLGYLLSLSGGMFLKPLLGVGAFFGQRKATILVGGTAADIEASLYGVVLRGGVDMIFYSSSRFNLFAGPEAILSLGDTGDVTVGGTAVEGRFFMSVDGGFNVGVSYVF